MAVPPGGCLEPGPLSAWRPALSAGHVTPVSALPAPVSTNEDVTHGGCPCSCAASQAAGSGCGRGTSGTAAPQAPSTHDLRREAWVCVVARAPRPGGVWGSVWVSPLGSSPIGCPWVGGLAHSPCPQCGSQRLMMLRESPVWPLARLTHSPHRAVTGFAHGPLAPCTPLWAQQGDRSPGLLLSACARRGHCPGLLTSCPFLTVDPWAICPPAPWGPQVPNPSPFQSAGLPQHGASSRPQEGGRAVPGAMRMG